jgi:hypothetical protein
MRSLCISTWWSSPYFHAFVFGSSASAAAAAVLLLLLSCCCCCLQEEPVYFNLVVITSTVGALALFAFFVGMLWYRQMLVF